MGSFHAFFHSISSMVFRLGGPGLLLVGVIDSSFLTAPLANDLLIIAQSATHPHRMFYYALTASVGSIIGCLSVDVICRKVEQRAKRSFPSGRWKFVESHFQRNAAWTVILASLMPPPFPFTPFVAAAAATGYPRKKLLGFVGIARLVRFTAEGALAIAYGKHILSLAKSPAVQYMVIALIVIAIVGSAISIFTWIRRSNASKRAKSQTRSKPHKH
jgi:membrane protein YqaA with SNARE-associated domain